MSHVMRKLEELVKTPLRQNSQYILTVLLNILPHCFQLLHRDQKVGQAADLARMKTEKENQQQRPAADRQPDKQPDLYNDRGTQAEPEQNEHIQLQ